MQKKFKKFLEDTSLSQAVVARSLGVSSSLISQWLKGNYKGDASTFEEKLANFMRNYSKKTQKPDDEERVYPTGDLKMAFFIMDEAVVNKEMALLYGEAGSGKTTAIKEYVKTHPEAVLVEVIPGMSVKSFLEQIVAQVGISGVSKVEEMVFALAEEFKKREAILIVDEAENLTTKALESIRKVFDFSRVPTVLVGTYGVLRNLKGRSGELLQLYSRISGRWEFRGLKESEWEEMFGEHAKEIKRYTTHLRRAVNIYRKAKRLADLSSERLNAGYIKKAASMMILD